MFGWFEENGLLLGLALLDGLAYAALVFMVAVGLNLVFGVLRVLNVAHGSLYAIGAYAAASLGLFLSAHGLPPWASLPVLLVAAALVGGILGPLSPARAASRSSNEPGNVTTPTRRVTKGPESCSSRSPDCSGAPLRASA